VATVAVWGITGPIFKYSDTWQLVINTGTTIVTFLMVFLIQNTQTRDTMALQLKLDELIIATKGGRNEIVGIEDASDEEISEEKKRINGVLTTKALKDPATCQNHRLKLSTIRWRTPAGGHGHRQCCTTDVQSVRKAVTDATSND
jgi:low affinity Fe/Cu permease